MSSQCYFQCWNHTMFCFIFASFCHLSSILLYLYFCLSFFFSLTVHVNCMLDQCVSQNGFFVCVCLCVLRNFLTLLSLWDHFTVCPLIVSVCFFMDSYVSNVLLLCICHINCINLTVKGCKWLQQYVQTGAFPYVNIHTHNTCTWCIKKKT